MEEKKLIVVMESDGKCIGFKPAEYGGELYDEVFCAGQECLFMHLKNFADGTDFNIAVLDGKEGEEFLNENSNRKIFIWRRHNRSPFSFCRDPEYIGTYISADTPNVEIVELYKDFKGVVVNTSCPAHGVYELESGGFIGDTVEDVNRCINTYHDVEFIRKQIRKCIRDSITLGIATVSPESFGIK